jgi:hypothetical protein
MDQDINKVKLGLFMLRYQSDSGISIYPLESVLVKKLIKVLEENFSDLSIQVNYLIYFSMK